MHYTQMNIAGDLGIASVARRRMLAADQYAVLRDTATERPYSNPLLHQVGHGVLACAGCDLDLFPSNTRFDSRIGWPSF